MNSVSVVAIVLCWLLALARSRIASCERTAQRWSISVNVGLRDVPLVQARHAVVHVLHARLERGGARLRAAFLTADTVRHHRDERDALLTDGKMLLRAEIGGDDVDALGDGGQEEVVLVLRARLADVGHAVDVDLVVARLAGI